jgi:hypothetical protein
MREHEGGEQSMTGIQSPLSVPMGVVQEAPRGGIPLR